MPSKEMSRTEKKILQARRLCHQLFFSSCVEEKRRGCHEALLRQRPHWSVLKKEEQMEKIDEGERIPFDITLPLPARDERNGSDAGVNLFWELFSCQRCGRCCFAPGAGLYLEKDDFEKIAGIVGKKRLISLCHYDKTLPAWILRQPCPFYDREKGCKIYQIRPQTCRKYPLHPPSPDMPYHLAADVFCPGARHFAKQTLGWWIICENHWAELLSRLKGDEAEKQK
jgi:Fe-S-cluster containining protein